MHNGYRQRPLTLVFTDIEGYSELWDRHGEAFLRAFAAHNSLLDEQCGLAGGQVVKLEGDAFFCVFTDPSQALRFALDTQQQLNEYDWTDHGIDDLKVRIGLHLGLVHERDGDYFGAEVNRAARICSAGHGGQILASEELLGACGELPAEVVVTDLARHRLRGLAEPQRLYQVTLSHWEQQEWPALRTLDHVPNNLPAAVTSFVGREQELEQLGGMLGDQQTRLLTLVGPGGSGKSRLAREAAGHALESFPDGVFWVPLADFSSPEAVPAAMLDVLKLQPQGEQRAAAVIANHTRDRQVLIILDNFEHLLEAADFLADLLEMVGSLKVLVTSREVLHLQGEQLLHVPPLALPEPPVTWQTLSQYDSVHLFLHRARAVSQGFTVTADNAAAVAEICLRLDGIPLAIELVAAWTGVFTFEEILRDIGLEARVLTSRVRGASERHRTMRGAFEWSYGLLSAREQEVFRRLCVFHGGFFREAAEAVCGPGAAEALINLHDKSLIDARDAAGDTRFHLLEVAREFGEEKLVEAGEEGDTRERHVSYYSQFPTDPSMSDEADSEAHFWENLTLEAPNLEAALRSALRFSAMSEAERLVILCRSMAHTNLSLFVRLLPMLDEALGQASGHERETWPTVVAQARLSCLFRLRRHDEGLRAAEDTFTLVETGGTREYRFRFAAKACELAVCAGDEAQQRRWVAEMGKWVETTYQRALLMSRLGNLGDLPAALAQAERCLADSERDGIAGVRRYVLVDFATLCLFGNEFDRALPHIAELMRLQREFAHRGNPAVIRWGNAPIITMLARSGEAEEAARTARESMSLMDRLEPGMRCIGSVRVVSFCAWGSLWDLAAELADEYLGAWPLADLPAWEVPYRGADMAEIYARCGDQQQATAAITPLLAGDYVGHERGALWGGLTVRQVAEVLRVCGLTTEAVQVATVALRLHSRWPFRKLMCEELLDLLAEETTAAAFARASGDSEAMDRDEAYALARRALGL